MSKDIQVPNHSGVTHLTNCVSWKCVIPFRHDLSVQAKEDDMIAHPGIALTKYVTDEPPKADVFDPITNAYNIRVKMIFKDL